jgi:hypothetical protein
MRTSESAIDSTACSTVVHNTTAANDNAQESITTVVLQ